MWSCLGVFLHDIVLIICVVVVVVGGGGGDAALALCVLFVRSGVIEYY